jgi:hypothetical protein
MSCIFDLERVVPTRAFYRNVRRMLESWVSELEPAVVISCEGKVVGLCVAGDDTGFVIVRAH